MSTFRIPIMGASTRLGNVGVFQEPASVKGTNDFFDQLVLVFNDTSTKDSIYGIFQVPQNYVGTPKFVVEWTSTATSGNLILDCDYRAVAIGESLDQASAQEALTVTDAAPGTTDLMQEALMAGTAGNFTVGDMVQFILSRDGASADTIAAAVTIVGVYFEYTDA
jgi:hypothetical protein